MVRTGLQIMALMACAAATLAQTPTTGLEAKVDAIFAPWTKAGSPGAAVAVYREGTIVLEKGFGLAHLEHDVAIKPETVFYLGSVSKQFVAAATFLLVQDGRITLDDDVRTHVPELPDYGTKITVRHLLHHTSGLRDYLGLLQLAGKPVDHYHDDGGIIAMLARQRALNFEPGSQFSYSNSGYFLLNVIIERKSGKPLRAFAEERIFKPLGMASTHFHDDFRHIIKNRAMGYFPGPDDSYRQFMSTFDRVGSGGVYSNVIDLCAWEQNFSKRTVGGDTLFEALHARGRLTDGTRLDYAAGLVHGRHRGFRTVAHSGALGGYRSAYLRFPDEKLAIAVLANLSSMNPTGLARRVADLYLPASAPKPAPAETPPPEPRLITRTVDELEPFAGHYWHRGRGLIREVRLIDGKLHYMRNPANRTELGATGPATFVMTGVGTHVAVTFDGSGMVVTAPGEGSIAYERFEPYAASTDEKALLAGSYQSQELDTAFKLAMDGKALLLHMQGRRVPLRSIVQDVYALPQSRILLSVTREPDGSISGFKLGAGSMRGFVFHRTFR